MIHRTKNGKREPLCGSPYALAFTDDRFRVTCTDCKAAARPDWRTKALEDLRPKRSTRPPAAA